MVLLTLCTKNVFLKFNHSALAIEAFYLLNTLMQQIYILGGFFAKTDTFLVNSFKIFHLIENRGERRTDPALPARSRRARLDRSSLYNSGFVRSAFVYFASSLQTVSARASTTAISARVMVRPGSSFPAEVPVRIPVCSITDMAPRA